VRIPVKFLYSKNFLPLIYPLLPKYILCSVRTEKSPNLRIFPKKTAFSLLILYCTFFLI
jgi:hypothetical protein